MLQVEATGLEEEEEEMRRHRYSANKEIMFYESPPPHI
jgi:hypothetical protein